MLRRRILIFVVLLVLVGALASAVAPRQDPARVVPGLGAGATSPPARVVHATLPPQREVRARVGDVVDLQVREDSTDEVEIVPLGLHAPVDPDLPGVLSFTADRPGRFAITLRDSGVRLGTLAVSG
jgi:hypothetical protein